MFLYKLFSSENLFSANSFDTAGANTCLKFLSKNIDKALIDSKILYTPILSGESITPKIKLKDCVDKSETKEFAYMFLP